MARSFYSFIDEFLQYKANRCTDRTLMEYDKDLRLFYQWLEERFQIKSIDQVETFHIRSFVLYLKQERENSVAGQQRKLSAVKGLFKFLYRENYLADDPSARVDMPYRRRKIPVYLTASESKELIESVWKNSRHPERDMAIFTLFLATGIRVSELVGLNVHDVDFAECMIKVLGKGQKERLVPLRPDIGAVIKQWLAVRPDVEDPALFLSQKKKRISPRTVQHMVKKFVLQTNIMGKKISPHKLRHTCATLLHQAGVDVRDLQELLGHESIATTQIYTQTNKEKLRSAVDKNPIFND